MEINIVSGSNAPETTNVIMGMYNDTDINVDVWDLSQENQTKYNNFIALVGDDSSVNITNCPFSMDANRVTPAVVSLNTVSYDYDTMSANDKIIVDEFATIFENM